MNSRENFIFDLIEAWDHYTMVMKSMLTEKQFHAIAVEGNADDYGDIEDDADEEALTEGCVL